MSRFAALVGVVLLAGSLWAAAIFAFPQVAQQPRSGGEAKAREDVQAKFEILLKRLPGILSHWCKDARMHQPRVRIARLTSSTEAKLTIEANYLVSEKDSIDIDCVFVLHLRYHAGVWTTIRSEVGPGTDAPGGPWSGAMQMLALAIDEYKDK